MYLPEPRIENYYARTNLSKLLKIRYLIQSNNVSEENLEFFDKTENSNSKDFPL